MPLPEELEKQGRWLFRRRSYLPLLLLPVLILALRDSESIEKGLGEVGENIYQGICIAISAFGLAARCYVVGTTPKGTSGRNREAQQAESLNITGMYSIVRHPLYLGNFLIFFGIALFPGVWWFVIIFALAFWLYYERIIFTEEAFLRGKFGEEFVRWAERTPAFVPNFRLWKPSDLPMAFRSILQREYSGFFAIIAAFTILKTIHEFFAKHRLELDRGWIIAFAAGLLIFLVLRTLRKKTKIFEVEGR